MGVYVAVFYLPKRCRLTIGQLGRFHFDAGFYAYVGSAQRNLAARLDRHARRRKPMRWHVDYLSRRAVMLGALTWDRPRECECQIARALAAEHDCPVAGFGSSDCHCPSHLFFLRADRIAL